jgi:hypothetical protein
MITCQSRKFPAKKSERIVSSEAASLKMPWPRILADLTPAPAKSSRQAPADSWWVMSTLSALNASVWLRNPATVSKPPSPVSSSLSSRSRPFCADIC